MKVTQPNHALFWWLSKLLCGFALITFVVLRFVAGAEPDWHSEIIVGQLFVVVFGVINLWHYYLLKCANTDIGKPTVLVSRGGLFRVIRHPMYFADIFIYFGLFLLCMQPSSLLVLLLGVLAIFKQAQVEDKALATQFAEEFAEWRARSSLLLPYMI